MTALHNFDAGRFLREHWQRKPLLIRNALPDFEDPLSPDELAGLSLEPEVESRLVEQGQKDWHLEQGPFTDTSFQRNNPWTLLVQSVDHYLPAVAAMRRLVDFLPSWRIDDILVSYASDGGGVGPHYDNYDVFLLQGMGQRRWRLGQHCQAKEALKPHQDLRILADFRQVDEYLLQPGDILYLPPRIAHWGIAVGECMTYSIGLRAPRVNDMLSHWLDAVLENMDPELFYRDPPLSADAAAAGEIDATSVDAARVQIEAAIIAGSPGSAWFGELLTEPRYGPIEGFPVDLSALPSEAKLAPAAKLAWSIESPGLAVFANGLAFTANRSCQPLLEQLCSGDALQTAYCSAAQRELLVRLYECGCLDHE